MRTFGLDMVPVVNRGIYGEMSNQMSGHWGNTAPAIHDNENGMNNGYSVTPMGNFNNSMMYGLNDNLMASYANSSFPMYNSSITPGMFNRNNYNSNCGMNDNSMAAWSNIFPAACIGGPVTMNYNTPNSYHNPMMSATRSMPNSAMMSGRLSRGVIRTIPEPSMSMPPGYMPSPISNFNSFNSWNSSPTLNGQMVETPSGPVPLWPGTSFEGPNVIPIQYQNMSNGRFQSNQIVPYGAQIMNNMEMGDMGNFGGYSMRGMIPMNSSRNSESKANMINTPMGTIEKIGETRRMVNMPNDMEIIGGNVRMTGGMPNINGNFGTGMNIMTPQYSPMSKF